MEKMPSPLALTVKVTGIADIDPLKNFSDYVHKIVSFIMELKSRFTRLAASVNN
jgi:hypothetical protein